MSIILNQKWEAIEELNQSVYTPQMMLVQESRILKHWHNMAVVPNKTTLPNKWSKYTFPELLWINLVFEMREFGLPLSRIKIVFDTLVAEKKGYWETLVHHLIYEEPTQMDLIIGKKEIYLFISGIAHFWIADTLKPIAAIVKPKAYLQININSVLEKILRTEELPLVSKINLSQLDNVS